MTEKIKIVFLINTLGFGGTERQLLETLRGLDKERFAPYVLSIPADGRLREAIERERIPGAYLGMSLSSGRFHPRSYLMLCRVFHEITGILRKERPHILQTYLFWTNIYGAIVGKIANVPVILTGRRETFDPRYKRFPNQWLQNMTNRTVTAVIANSHAVKAECLQHERHLDASRIEVIHNGVDIERFRGGAASIRLKQELDLPDDAMIVGIVGRLHPRKGHRIFLEAAAHILRVHPRARFLIIGRDQGMQADLMRQAEQTAIRHAVRFLGEQRDIPDLLALLDVQVCASFIEGLSNAVLEGMASGKPVVATNIAGNPELISDGDTGLLIPAGDAGACAEAVCRLLADRELRNKMGAAAQARVRQHFSVARMISQTEAVYEKYLRLIKPS